MMREQMIREGLAPSEATSRFYPLTSKGLLLSDSPGLLDFQEPYARSRDEVASWAGDSGAGRIGLAEVVAHAHPTMLIGTSTHSGAFTEAIVKDMPPTPIGRSSCRCPTPPRNVRRYPKTSSRGPTAVS